MKRLKRIAAIAAQTAMLAQAALWVIFAVMRIIDISGSMDMVWALLMLKILTLAFLLVNLVLTVTDQMGVYDWLALGLNIVSLGGVVVSYWSGSRKDTDKAG